MDPPPIIGWTCGRLLIPTIIQGLNYPDYLIAPKFSSSFPFSSIARIAPHVLPEFLLSSQTRRAQSNCFSTVQKEEGVHKQFLQDDMVQRRAGTTKEVSFQYPPKKPKPRFCTTAQGTFRIDSDPYFRVVFFSKALDVPRRNERPTQGTLLRLGTQSIEGGIPHRRPHYSSAREGLMGHDVSTTHHELRTPRFLRPPQKKKNT